MRDPKDSSYICTRSFFFPGTVLCSRQNSLISVPYLRLNGLIVRVGKRMHQVLGRTLLIEGNSLSDRSHV